MNSVLLLLVACLGSTEKGFPDAYAEAVCRYDEHCHKSLFVEDYDDIDECVDDILDNVDDGANCAFDTDEARTCLKEMRDARQDCDDGDRIPEACFDAFDCPGVLPSELSAETYFRSLIDVYCSLDCGSSYLDDLCANPEEYTATGYECPEFDLDKAEECLDPANWECSENYYGDGGVPMPPRVCNEVCYGGYDYTDTTYTY
jgi:hypothetical protein